MATALVTAPGVGIHNVLIATDFSHHSHCALKLGLAFAHLYGARAEVVYVLPTEEYAMAGPETLLTAKDAARRDLLDLKASLRRSLAFEEGEDYHVSMLEGAVTDCLLQWARDKRTDLIVVGTHGRGRLGKITLGSVAENLFRHSPVPVLTIGPHIGRPRDFGNARHILALCDLAPNSHPAIRFACSLAREHNSQLTLLHVIEHPTHGMKLDPERLRQGIMKELAGVIGKCGEGVELRYRIESGIIAATILDVAAETDTDLIVLGVRPSAGFVDRFMWPIAYALVREAACPVLTIRGGVAYH